MIVFITGANRGIGLYQLKYFLEDGDVVIGTFRSERDSLELFELQKEYPDRCFAIQGDVTSDADIEKISSEVLKHVSSIDILINNAGTDVEHHNPGLEEVPVEVISRTFDINTLGMIRVCKALLPLLRKSERGGVVVNTTSGIGSMTNDITMTRYGYMMSKAAVNILSRIMAFEFEKDGITTIAWSPGWVRTRLGTDNATYSLDEAGRMNVDVIKKVKAEHNGLLMDISGQVMAF